MISSQLIAIIIIALVLLLIALAILFALIKKQSVVFKIKAIYILAILFAILSIKSLWSYHSYIKQSNIFRADLSVGTSEDQISVYLEKNKKNMNISKWDQYSSGNDTWFFISLKYPPPIIALSRCEINWIIRLDNNKTIKSIDWGGCI